MEQRQAIRIPITRNLQPNKIVVDSLHVVLGMIYH